MTDDNMHVSRLKGRSASICAATSASIEGLPQATTTTPDGGGTPTSSRRRKPAARSQSARLTSGRSIKRRVAAAATANHHQSATVDRGHCNSEPKLDQSEPTPDATASPNVRRKNSTRRGTSVYHRKSTAFLDVPDNRAAQDEEDEDSYRLRSFSFTSKGKGIVNRGDSFRRRRSRSNSLCPPHLGSATPSPIFNEPHEFPLDVANYIVALLGTQGVGKTALISQFMTSECINAYDRQKDSMGIQTVSIMLNGEESELTFLNVSNPKEIDKSNPPDAFVVLYSVVDKASFLKAEAELTRLHDADLLRSRPAILVGNKVDLARSRAVSTQDGKCLACTYRAKFIEISVGINHNVDELLVGILTQIRLKHYQNEDRDPNQQQWYKSRGVVKASMKARQMFTWLFGKEDSKFKNCENLHIL